MEVERTDERQAATHALIISVGGYRSLPGLQLQSAGASASALSDWFQKQFRNVTAPLGSIETLASQDGLLDSEWPAPTIKNIRRSVEKWVYSVRSHPGNIAFLYFGGHTPDVNGDTLLLADDVSLGRRDGDYPDETSAPSFQSESTSAALSLNNLLEALDGAECRGQLVIVDGCRDMPGRLDYSGLRAGPRLQVWRERALSPRLLIYGAEPGEFTYAPAGARPSFLVQAFLDQMRTADHGLDSQAIAQGVVERTGILAAQMKVKQLPKIDMRGNFPFIAPVIDTLPNEAPMQPASGSVASVAHEPDPTIQTEDSFVSPVSSPASEPAPSSVGASSVPPTVSPVTGPEVNQEPSILPESSAGSPPVPAPASPQSSAQDTAGPVGTPPPDLDFLDDDAEVDDDALGRGGIAIVLARRLHMIWCKLNRDCARSKTRASFVLHLDAPWGGGKTTFANFIARVLNPYGYGGTPAGFLRARSADEAAIGRMFYEKIALTAAEKRPWIIVEYNAWQSEHISPPWWAFYQVIRHTCFDAVRKGDASPEKAGGQSRRWAALKRWGGLTCEWLWLWIRELGWRLWTPKLILPLTTFLLVLALNLGLQWWGAAGVGAKSSEKIIGPVPDNFAGWLLLASGGLTALGGALSLLVGSLAPGVDPLAERLSLGQSDPLERFRRHFHKTMVRMGRPILVVVDDLDRCKPDVIVDLVRGMRTILRSPRVVFLILGDREWLERAFEAKHGEMLEVSGSAEQSIGARFVEKAIQLSYLLPGLDPQVQVTYVGGLLDGAQGIGPAAQALKAAARDAEIALRVKVREETEKDPTIVFEAETLRDRIKSEWLEASTVMDQVRQRAEAGVVTGAGAGASAATSAVSAEDAANQAVGRIINDELAIAVAATPDVDKVTARRLVALAPWLPANPRQIKRIINSFAIHHAAALQHPTYSTTGDGWFRLATWVVLMVEWPTTWRLLASCPELADMLAQEDPSATVKACTTAQLPGSFEATLKELQRMKTDDRLMGLVGGQFAGGVRLDKAAVVELLKLTPPYARAPRLPDPAPPKT
ncbi:P-loop NTPase fold protein [Novosphingobium aerophilum]|uniref:P-loop NTPase fold protein n=1 Tax=Novosphingobium aerophilum TaxID=2839843 RepID=UPI003FD588A2